MTVILAGFSTMGITCGKTLPAACCFTWNILYVLYTGSGKCEQLLPNVSREILSAIWGRCGTGKAHSPRAVLPEQTGIGIRPICFTWNNWESKHDNTKLGVNVRSKVKKHCGGTKLSAGTGQGNFIKNIEELSVCGKPYRYFDRRVNCFTWNNKLIHRLSTMWITNERLFVWRLSKLSVFGIFLLQIQPSF